MRPALQRQSGDCAPCALRESWLKRLRNPEALLDPHDQSFDDLINYRVDDVLYVSLIKMWVLRSDTIYQLGFYHVQPWIRGWQIAQMSVKQASPSHRYRLHRRSGLIRRELALCAVTTPRLRSLRPPHLSDLKLQAPAWLPACGIDLAAPLRSNG